MAPLTGMRLTLPDDQVFRISSDVTTIPEQVWQWLFNGGEQALSLYEQFVAEDGGQSGRGDGLKQSGALGAGAGRHVIKIDAIQYVDSEDTWGDTDPGDPAITKRDTFNNALNTVRIASNNVAVLEFGEYSSNGKFGPLPVVCLQSTLPLGPDDEAPSAFGVNLELLETADLEQTIHGIRQSGA